MLSNLPVARRPIGVSLSRAQVWSLIGLALMLCSSLLAPTRAQAAASCSVSIGATNFGSSISPLTQTQIDGTATLTFGCTGVTPYIPLSVCPNLDSGSGGNLPGGMRLLAGP